MAADHTASARIGLFGKHRSAGDFLRFNSGSNAAQRLDEWLADALVQSRELLGDRFETSYDALGPTIFLINDAPGDRCLFGVMVSSMDSAGRRFPLSVFADLPRGALAGKLAALPHERFLVDVVTLLEQRQALDHQQLVARVEMLAPPSVESLEQARLRHEHFATTTTSGATFGELFRGRGADYWGQTVHTVKQAGMTAAPRGQGGPSYGVLCPLGSQPSAHVGMWLSLLQRALAYGAAPSALWNRHTLLLFVGPLGRRALGALLDPARDDDSVYDLRRLTALTGATTIAANAPLLSALEA